MSERAHRYSRRAQTQRAAALPGDDGVFETLFLESYGLLLLLLFILELVGFERGVDLDLLNLDLFSDLTGGRPDETARQAKAIDVAVVRDHPSRLHLFLRRRMGRAVAILIALALTGGRRAGLGVLARHFGLVAQQQNLMRLPIYEKTRREVVRASEIERVRHSTVGLGRGLARISEFDRQQGRGCHQARAL